jgi:hypothetical protein
MRSRSELMRSTVHQLHASSAYRVDVWKADASVAMHHRACAAHQSESELMHAPGLGSRGA